MQNIDFKKYKKIIKQQLKSITSPKLEKYKKLKIITMIVSIIFYICMILFLAFKNWLGYLFIGFYLLASITSSVIEVFMDKEFGKLTKYSFLYYVGETDQILIYKLPLFLFLSFASFLMCLFFSNFNWANLNNVNLSLCAIIFSLYVFTIPTASKYLKEKTYKYKNSKNIDIYFKMQGKIYSDKMFVNKLFRVITEMIIILLISEFLYFWQTIFYLIFGYMCFLYNFYTLSQLLIVIYKIYKFDIDELSVDMYNDCINKKLIQGKRINNKK